MKAAIAVLMVGTLLAGCSSSRMEDARSAGPYRSLNSSKPVDTVAQCTESTWQSQAFFGDEAEAWLDTQKDRRFTAYTRDSTYFADFKPADGGTAIAFYSRAGNTPMAARRLAALATCL